MAVKDFTYSDGYGTYESKDITASMSFSGNYADSKEGRSYAGAYNGGGSNGGGGKKPFSTVRDEEILEPQVPRDQWQENGSPDASSYAPFALYNGATRLSYASEVYRLKSAFGGNPTDGVSPNLAGNNARYALKLKYRGYAIPGTEQVLDLVEPLEKVETRVRYWRTRTPVNALGALGVIGGIVGAGNTIYNISTSDNPMIATAYESGGWAGSIAGMRVAAHFAARSGNVYIAFGIMAAGGIAGAYIGEQGVHQLLSPSPRVSTARFYPQGGVVFPSDRL